MANEQALAVIKPDQLTAENLPKLKQENFLVLTPTSNVQQINEFCGVQFSHVPVRVAFDEGKTSNVDIWKVPGGGGNYAPTKVLLNKIASAANIQFDVMETKRVDDRRDRFYCSYQAVAFIRLPSGEIKHFRDEATEDAHMVEEETLEKWTEKIGKTRDEWVDRVKKKVSITKEFAETAARKEFRAYHKFFEERCLTRAMNRCIRQVLAMNGTYTLPELQKGFVVPQITFTPDLKDPKSAQLMERLLFGGIQGGSRVRSGELALPPAQENPLTLPAPAVDAFSGETEPTEAELAELEAICESTGKDASQDSQVVEAEVVESHEATIALHPEAWAKLNEVDYPLEMNDPDGFGGVKFPPIDVFNSFAPEGQKAWEPKIKRALEIAKHQGKLPLEVKL